MQGQISTLLLVGLPIDINNKFKFTAPIFKDILTIDYDVLMGYIQAAHDINYMMYTNKEINKLIEENDFCSFDTWQLILLLEKETKTFALTTYLVECLQIHLHEDVIIDDDCRIIVGGKEFNKDDYEYFDKILKVAYELEERIEDRKFGSIVSRRKAIEMRISRNEIYKIESKKSSFIYQIISVLKIKKSDTDIQNSNLFQLIDIYKRLIKEKNYDNLMVGVYTGNVDTKKVNLDKEHWTSNMS